MHTLLIIGAGGHGRVVAEIAVACGYERKSIAFLDDNATDAIGKIEEIDLYAPRYDGVFVAIGNNELRQRLTVQLYRLEGARLVTLIHPTAYVSLSAIIGQGTVVEPKAVINTNSRIGQGCIISVGTIIDHDCEIGDFCHINAGMVCGAGSRIDALSRISK
jgi:UDP-N-acetylbacillosamine N-acetyltransferase